MCFFFFWFKNFCSEITELNSNLQQQVAKFSVSGRKTGMYAYGRMEFDNKGYQQLTIASVILENVTDAIVGVYKDADANNPIKRFYGNESNVKIAIPSDAQCIVLYAIAFATADYGQVKFEGITLT